MPSIIECPDSDRMINDKDSWTMSSRFVTGIVRKKFFGTEKDVLHVVKLPEQLVEINGSTFTLPPVICAHFDFNCPARPDAYDERTKQISGTAVIRDTNNSNGLVFFGSFL